MIPPQDGPYGQPQAYAPVRDPRLRRAGFVAATLSVAFALGQFVDFIKPPLHSMTSMIDIQLLPLPGVFDTTRVAVYVGWAVAAAAVGVIHSVDGPGSPVPDPLRRRGIVARCQWLVLAALLLPLSPMPAQIFWAHPLKTAICLPTTVFGLWSVHRMQRFRRMPFRLLLLAAGLGAFVASGFAGSMNTWFMHDAPGYLVDWSHPDTTERTVMTLIALNAGVFEELGKAVCVALVYVLARRHVDDLVSGLVLGAAVGLGFNFSESVLYMSGSGGSQAASQFWTRQTIGLMAAHTAFTAVIGASIGAARQLQVRQDKLRALACGYLAGAGGHFEADTVIPHLSRWESHLFDNDQVLQTLLGTPLTICLTSGPFVLLYLLLLRHGTRRQAAAYATELQAEADSGSGAVTDVEVPILLSPLRRLLLAFMARRREGKGHAVRLRRLHRAQLDLAAARWHDARAEADPYAPGERALRERVLELKRGPADPVGAVPALQEARS